MSTHRIGSEHGRVAGASEKLRASEERFRLLVDGVQDYAIFMLDPEGRIVSWNAGARRIKGYEPEEIIGERFTRFYPQEALARGWPDHELEVTRREGRFEDEGWRLRKDGTRFWAHVVITALRDETGRILGFSKITHDLTERREQEEALRQSEERFRLLVESVRDHAMFMLDPEGHVISWNLGAERIKGYRADEIVGRHFSRFYPPDAVARGRPEHGLAIAADDGRFEDEGWRIRRDGSRFWANVVLTAIRDPAGKLLGFAKVTRDLTERRRVEALEEEGRRLNRFLAVLGHELRNPLAPIRNAAGLLRASGEAPRATILWSADVIDRQVTHLGRIVDDLIDLGRISAGRISIRREPIDLGVVVAKAIDSMRPMLEAKGQRLEVRIEPVTVSGDATRLAQIVMNLLANAHKYTPPRGHLEVVVERDGQHAQLRVRDDGTGIAPDLLPQIYEPFVQGDDDPDRAGGLGIGLTLVRRLVELHHGTVSATSPGVGRGSEFVVRLPSAPVAGGAERPSSEPAPARPPGCRVLVVDDNEDSVDTLGLLLEVWGHEVRTAADGPSALEAASEFHPDVVLLDIGLPGMDGYEVAERLRDTPCVLVALTGFGLPSDAERARRAGFRRHFVKPVSCDELEQFLADLSRNGG